MTGPSPAQQAATRGSAPWLSSPAACSVHLLVGPRSALTGAPACLPPSQWPAPSPASPPTAWAANWHPAPTAPRWCACTPLRTMPQTGELSPVRGGTGATHYRMRQKLVSIGDDYWIENDRGERVFKVDGKAVRLRNTLIFEDSHGSELLKIQQRVARARDTMEIEDRGGRTVATVKKALTRKRPAAALPEDRP